MQTQTNPQFLALIFLTIAGCGDNDRIAPDADIGVTPDAIVATFDGSSTGSDAAAPPRKLAVIFGQSNAGTPGRTADLAGLGRADLGDPYPAVPYISETGTDNNPPITQVVPLGPLAPIVNTSGIGTFGIELSLGRALDAAEPGQWAIARFAFGSTALAGEWAPNANWPTGEPNLFTQEITFVQQALAATGTELGALIWIQGESDAPTVALGQAYGLHLAEFIGAERLELPADPRVPFVYGRLNVNNPQLGTADVRTGQEANQNVYAIMVDQDPFPLQADLTHYTSQGDIDLGTLYATTILDFETRVTANALESTCAELGCTGNLFCTKAGQCSCHGQRCEDAP